MLGMSLSVICGLALLSFAYRTSASIINDLANLDVKYENLGYHTINSSTINVYNSSLTLTNTGGYNIISQDEDVNIYVCFIRLIVESDSDGGVELETNGDSRVTAHHLDGCSHKLTFHSPFSLSKSQSMKVYMTQQFWFVAFTDAMPNWYMQLGNGEHKIMLATAKEQTEFVAPFETEQQYLRLSFDQITPWTPEERLARFQMARQPVSGRQVRNRLVPSTTNPFEAERHQMIGPYPSLSQVDIRYVEHESMKRDAHTIQIESSGVVKISAASMQSFLLAKSTVQQMLEHYNRWLPVGVLPNNKPRFEHRGFSLDISRHFRTKETIKRHLDLMWRYKLNTLHLHFTDDESWAVEIEDLPELTEVGTKHCFDLEACLTYPQLGVEANQENQFLTKQDYIEVVSYAASKGIEVIPEVDLPGHATAAIQAMRIRHQRDPTAVDYRLHDPDDTSEYLTVQYFTRSAMNPCINSSYDFIQLVAETLVSYHQQAGQPLRVLHLGGDEVPETAWEESPICEELLASRKFNGTGKNYLKKMMLGRMGKIASSLGLSLAFWEDGLINRDVPNTPYIKGDIFPSDIDVFSYTWQTVWEWLGGSRPYNMANSGFKVVMCPATRFYLDHSQEPNSKERGYYWARRFTDLIRPFAFRFKNFYSNIDGTDRFGAPLSKETFCETEGYCPELTRPENIVGGNAVLFSETIFTRDDMDNNVWPRAMAIAERLWTEAEWEKLEGEFPEGLQEDFSSFREVLDKYELPCLDYLGVKYHLSPPAFSVKENGNGTFTLSNFTGEFSNQKVWLRNEYGLRMLCESDTYLYTPEKTIYFSTSTKDALRYSYEIEFRLDASQQPTATSHQ